MSAERTSSRLLRAYPSRWRERYGEELEALLVEANGSGRVPWSARVDVVRAGLGERLRAAGLRSDGSPPERVRASVLRVLCAWALFVIGGLVLAKFSEHWQGAVRPGAGSLVEVAFADVLVGAAAASALIVAGVLLATPAFLRSLRAGGWARARGPLRLSGLLAAVLILATAGLALWGGDLRPHQRNGDDVAYAVAFLGWAVLVCLAVLTWAGAAVAIARGLELRPRVAVAEAWLAAGVATVMVVVAAATVVWWVGMASAAPGFLDAGIASTLPPQLLVAVGLMLLGVALAAPAAWRALRDARELAPEL